MPDIVNTLGALAGLGAFVGLGVLAVLYFSQARDVRRLRDWAGRAPERAAAAEEALAAYETGTQPAVVAHAEEGQAVDHAAAQAPPPSPGPVTEEGMAAGPPTPAPVSQQAPARPPEDWQIEAEAAAAAEISERRERREQMGDYTGGGGGLGGFELRSPLVVLIGGAILVFALVFGAIHLLGGGGGEKTAQTTKAKTGASQPAAVRVAVLNGTAVPGLAAKVGDDVRGGGFKLGAVTNSETSFDTTLVMYRRGHQPEAEEVAKQIGVQDVELMSPEIQRVSKGAQVAVVVGNDRAPAGGATGSTTPGATTPGVTGTPSPTPAVP